MDQGNVAPPEPSVEDLSKDQIKAMIDQRTSELEAAAAAEGTAPATKLQMTPDGCIMQTVADEATAQTADAPDPEYTPAAAFEGARPGFVFRAGPQGLGYYTDSAGRLVRALHKLEAKIDPQAAAQRALEDTSAMHDAPAAATPAEDETPKGTIFEVTFDAAKWGMTTRMYGGPVVVTKVKPAGQAEKAGIAVNDVVVKVDGISVVACRTAALNRLRKGGAAVVEFVRPEEGATAAVAPGGLMGVGSGDAMVKSLGGAAAGGDAAAEDGWSVKQVQAMIGTAKAKDTVTVGGKKGVTATVADGEIDANATLVFVGCEDCTYTVESYCVKLYIQDCRNITINANSRIITSMIEVFKGSNVTLNVNTDCGTLQADMVDGLSARFVSKDRYTMAVWAGCENVDLSFADHDERITTGYAQVSENDTTLTKERSQFRVSWVGGKLVQEKLIRLENGFATTQREKAEFELKQEATLKALAKEMGITIGRPNEGIKVKPNELCPCGSGLKFKKCCFSIDGLYKGNTTKDLAALPVIA